MKVNDVIHGFRLLKTQTIKEVDSEAFEFIHEKSGARLFFLKNDDDNKVFSITFRTPPYDDRGLPHVVEHSTLCGSRKFPLKEPFVELVKGSLNTFLNAITFPDKTMYPVASRNTKDFNNLMDVYLDAVFYPAMYDKKEVLMQEGWHYEIGNVDEPLRYSGVVYNEMKGATSSPEDLLETEAMKAIYPDTAYHFESGGNPEHITELTHDDFIAFHKKYYHPSNSYIYLYGDMDIDERLKFLDEEYLSDFTKIEVDSEIKNQALFHDMKRVKKEYPIGAEEDDKDKTYLLWGAIGCENGDRLTRGGLAILVHALFLTDAAPVRQAIIDAGIGKDITASLDGNMIQPCLSVEVTNANAGDAERFYDVMMGALRKIKEDGIDRALLEASLNIEEFKLREADFGQTPKGLVYNMTSLTSWLYDDDPGVMLYYEDDLRKLRDGIGNGFFEGLIDKCFINNPHQVLLTMSPSKTMAAEREKKTLNALAEKKSKMSSEQIEEIIKTTSHLKEFQETPDTPEALATIPLLSLSDIEKKAEKLPLEIRDIDGTKTMYSDLSTHGIAYIAFYFDGSMLTPELQNYGYLLCDILGSVDTGSRSYQEVTTLMNLHTGGISYKLEAGSKVDASAPDGWFVSACVKSRALIRKLPELSRLLIEILTDSKFDSKKRIRELIEQCIAGWERQTMNMPQLFMAKRLASYISAASKFNTRSDLDYYNFLKDIADHYEERFEELSRKLKKTLSMVYNRKNLVVGITTSRDDYEAAAKSVGEVLEALPNEEYPDANQDDSLKIENEGLTSSSRVQYVGKAANFLRMGYKYTGVMRVVETIMRYGYLWTNIRVKGGAYGASAKFARDGLMMFTSYRDPNLRETLDAFDGIADYLKNFTADDREMTKYIIGTIASLDMPMSPYLKGSVAMSDYLSGLTYEAKQRQRDEVLACKVDDVRGISAIVDRGMKENIYCVLGNEETLKDNKELFKRLIPVMK
ncbi:MAG: insulinase family protein [Schwartzia sp.]|nr:insulinase family protein [Schwartzia sp. (in: firmicutes)]